MCIGIQNKYYIMGQQESTYYSEPVISNKEIESDTYKYMDPLTQTLLPTTNPKAYLSKWVRQGEVQAVYRGTNPSTDLRGGLDHLVGATEPFSNANPRTLGAVVDRSNLSAQAPKVQSIQFKNFCDEVERFV